MIVIVWDNEMWGQTGAQPTHTAYPYRQQPPSNRLDSASYIPRTATVDDEEALATVFRQAMNEDGPWLIVAKIEEEGYLPTAPASRR
ncbi:hypothetical protein GBAR_LOCUS31661 [Geodia barretti]|uniref:Thiamine pyrophosphate enzyme TPP-binding domain-containing protein n=1 Tax=Geodia barretti TaxID=519541 RepID=A0AA35U2K3_GEOBA|nr:hypothetical protein GBAR_LOCUS31661 [Geodia barretti]